MDANEIENHFDHLTVLELVYLVISIGHSPAFYVLFVPLEYIPSIPPHSTYVIVIHTFGERGTIELHLQGDELPHDSFFDYNT